LEIYAQEAILMFKEMIRIDFLYGKWWSIWQVCFYRHVLTSPLSKSGCTQASIDFVVRFYIFVFVLKTATASLFTLGVNKNIILICESSKWKEEHIVFINIYKVK
jgi:hypothetical protein